MPLTPQDVRNKVFTATRFRAGYSEEEVDDFLEEVETEIGRLISENGMLRRQLGMAPGQTVAVEDAPAVDTPKASHHAHAADSTPAPAPVPTPAPVPVAEPVKAPPVEAPVVAAGAAAASGDLVLPADSDAENLLRRTLVLAQRTAEEAVREARENADKMRADAREESDKMRAEAKQRYETELGKITEDRTALQSQVDQLRAFEREYRTRLRAYLELQLRELDAPGTTSSQLSGAPSRPPLSPGQPPAGTGPGGGAGSGPAGASRPEGGSPFAAGPPSGDEPKGDEAKS
jgi:DivIVA domain-containing protein